MSKHSDSTHGTDRPVREDWTEEQTGRGGSLGAPTTDSDEMPASGDVEAHEAVSGGGVVEHEDLEGVDSSEGTTEID
jgi:hypothetical protein